MKDTYASAHICLLNSACLARFSAFDSFLLVGAASVSTIAVFVIIQSVKYERRRN